MMEHLNETRLAYWAATACLALSHVYFLARDFRGDKVYLITRTRERALTGSARGRPAARGSHQLREKQLRNRSNLPNLDAPLGCWYKLTFYFNLLLALKYLVLCALDSKSLQQYRFLDCYLLGRISLDGRVVGMVKYGGLVLVSFQVAWRSIMLFVQPKFSFPAMEFLMRDPDELIEWEADKARCVRGDLTRVELRYAPLLDYKNPYITPNSHNSQQLFRMRPNRTLEVWRGAARYLLAYLAIVLLSFGLAVLPLIRMSAAMVFTQAGFKLNYRYCLEWVREQPNRRDYEFIYEGIANDTGARPPGRAFMPLENFVELNSYQLARILADSLETTLVFAECVLSFTFNTALAVMAGRDTLAYCRSLNARVARLMHSMSSSGRPGGRLDSTVSLNSLTGAGGQRGPAGQRQQRQEAAARWAHQEDILDLQASIKDLFSQIEQSNSYAATFTLAAVTIWFLYSAICASWLFVPDETSESGRLEWYVIQAISTGFICIAILCFNAVRLECTRLYLAIARLAGLEGNAGDMGKVDRWLCLMRHYAPVPLAFFTTSRRSPISWLLGVKLLSWMASALFVASGFFVPVHQQA